MKKKQSSAPRQEKNQATEQDQTSEDQIRETPTTSDLSGFNQADTDLDNFDTWDFDNDPVLNGVVIKVKSATVSRRNQEDAETRLAVVRVGDEPKLLWESANLEKFFDILEPDMHIQVVYRGKEPLSGGRSMRKFDAYYK